MHVTDVVDARAKHHHAVQASAEREPAPPRFQYRPGIFIPSTTIRATLTQRCADGSTALVGQCPEQTGGGGGGGEQQQGMSTGMMVGIALALGLGVYAYSKRNA
jgi:hypothetical protein